MIVTGIIGIQEKGSFQMTYEAIVQNKEILAYYERSSIVLDSLGYTDHSVAHTKLVAERAADILKAFDYGSIVFLLTFHFLIMPEKSIY